MSCDLNKEKTLEAVKHVCIIGGGPGGYPAAFFAADRGMKVTLIDRESAPGGVCLYRGCIPSKTLLHAAKLIHETRDASSWGLHFEAPKIKLSELREFSQGVVRKLTSGLGVLANKRDINFIKGEAKILAPQRVAVQGADGDEHVVEADYIVVATGSAPTQVAAFKMDHPRVMDSSDALQLEDIPERLLVIGGGYIGLELGTVYAALGSKVSVVEANKDLLAAADRDLVKELERRLPRLFEAIYRSTKVLAVEPDDEGVSVKMSGLEVGSEPLRFDKVLVAIGRKPRAQGVGLENTAAVVDKGGWIEVDGQRRTAEPTLFAIGDVAGEPMLAHKATYEARIAIEAIDGEASAYEPAAIPAVVFTDPEIAWCGLTEEEARRQGIDYKVTRFPWSASGRATTMGRSDGLTKMILEAQSERILGVGIAGMGAGELIAEGVLAVEMGALASDLQLVIHAHPTLSETMMEAAEMFHGSAAHYMPPKK